MSNITLYAFAAALAAFPFVGSAAECNAPCVSGIYPHLAMFNDESECGVGGMVEWAGRMWIITYGRPMSSYGSTDKLYELTPDLKQIVHNEEIGGTPANRMIHRESKQLIIGSYFIDAAGNVRIIPSEKMSGRLTGTARHLQDPVNKVYVATMEEGLYEVDVRTLEVKTLIRDGLSEQDARRKAEKLPYPANWENAKDSKFLGTHGKGLCTGFGQLFYANNGEGCYPWKDPSEPAGALGSWKPGDSDWSLIKRRQYTDISTADGVYGNEHPYDNPILAMGWDHRSAFIDVISSFDAPTTYRFPKGSYTYDGTHGWYTEWPRIRPVSDDEMLATMHGTLLSLPRSFAKGGNMSGLRPLSNYLKVVGDFTPWLGKIVFGCDDTARTEFSNLRKVKSGLTPPGRSQSNLWFVDRDKLGRIGPLVGHGGVWMGDDVVPLVPSDAYLLAGYSDKALYIRHGERHKVSFDLEVDADGRGEWKKANTVVVPPAGLFVDVSGLVGEWVRVVPQDLARNVTAWFEYAGSDPRVAAKRTAAYPREAKARLLVTKANPNVLTIAADSSNGWQLGADLALSPVDGATASKTWSDAKVNGGFIKEDAASIIYVDDDGRTWRLPRAAAGVPASYGRVCREVCTERDLFSAGGTFFELPAPTAGDFAKVRAVSSPVLPIADYASWRGLLALAVEGGERPETSDGGPRIIDMPQKELSLWLGATDDVWKLGKAVGVGGPWMNTKVAAGIPSDPYLANGYDAKSIAMEADRDVEVTLEADPSGDGVWYPVGSWKIAAGVRREVRLPAHLNASWLRVKSSADAVATAQFVYE